jgi:hypothetical protein
VGSLCRSLCVRERERVGVACDGQPTPQQATPVPGTYGRMTPIVSGVRVARGERRYCKPLLKEEPLARETAPSRGSPDRYPAFPIHVALLRGTTADAHGNVSMEHEAMLFDVLNQAMAVKASGGTVIVQARGPSLPPRRGCSERSRAHRSCRATG